MNNVQCKNVSTPQNRHFCVSQKATRDEKRESLCSSKHCPPPPCIPITCRTGTTLLLWTHSNPEKAVDSTSSLPSSRRCPRRESHDASAREREPLFCSLPSIVVLVLLPLWKNKLLDKTKMIVAHRWTLCKSHRLTILVHISTSFIGPSTTCVPPPSASLLLQF